MALLIRAVVVRAPPARSSTRPRPRSGSRARSAAATRPGGSCWLHLPAASLRAAPFACRPSEPAHDSHCCSLREVWIDGAPTGKGKNGKSDHTTDNENTEVPPPLTSPRAQPAKRGQPEPSQAAGAVKHRITNCHAHTFTHEHSPDRFVPWPLVPLTNFGPFRRAFIALAHRFSNKNRGTIERYAEIVETSFAIGQAGVFEKLAARTRTAPGSWCCRWT